MKKKLVLSLAAAAMVGTLAVGGTLAWFTDTETAVNVVTTGNVDIAWYEGADGDSLKKVDEDYKGMQFGDTKPVVPGQNLDKMAVVKNEGKNPAYVRAQIEVLDEKGQPVTEADLALLEFVGLNDKWEEDGGYYYYKDVVDTKKPGNQTEPIMTDVKVKPSANNEELADKKFTINLLAEAVQSDELGVDNCKAAFGLEGLDIVEYKAPSAE